MSGAMGIREYVFEQMNRLLTRLVFQVHHAAKVPGPDEIHDLRVSIRRFSQGLRLFSDFFPKWEVKKIEKLLKRMMRLTSEIRDRDIALEFLTRHLQTKHRQRLEHERRNYERQFSQMVRRWSGRDFSAKWRNSLSLRGL
jgi:CHAD domain-containing protein